MKFKEAINDGLHAIASGIKDNAIQLEIDREKREDNRLKGYMTDEEKLRLLMYDLYSATRANARPDYTCELRMTCTLLSNEIDRKHKRDYSLVTILNEGARTFLGLSMLAVVASYTVLWSGACNHVNSQFCRNARMIPNAVERYFYDEPVLVNPVDDIDVNIDQVK